MSMIHVPWSMLVAFLLPMLGIVALVFAGWRRSRVERDEAQAKLDRLCDLTAHMAAELTPELMVRLLADRERLIEREEELVALLEKSRPSLRTETRTLLVEGLTELEATEGPGRIEVSNERRLAIVAALRDVLEPCICRESHEPHGHHPLPSQGFHRAGRKLIEAVTAWWNAATGEPSGGVLTQAADVRALMGARDVAAAVFGSVSTIDSPGLEGVPFVALSNGELLLVDMRPGERLDEAPDGVTLRTQKSGRVLRAGDVLTEEDGKVMVVAMPTGARLFRKDKEKGAEDRPADVASARGAWGEPHRRQARALWLCWWAHRALEGANVEHIMIQEQHVGSADKFRSALYANGYPREDLDDAVRSVLVYAAEMSPCGTSQKGRDQDPGRGDTGGDREARPPPAARRSAPEGSA